MKVLVLGAGVISVTSAWYMAKAGCDITVIDRYCIKPKSGHRFLDKFDA